MGYPSNQFEGSSKFMIIDWKLYPGNLRLPSNTTRKQKSVFIEIGRETERQSGL